METLGDRIEFYRKKRGLSRENLAELIGVHINTLGHWIRDEKEPGVKKVQLLAYHLNVDPTELITGEPAVQYAARRKLESLYLSDKASRDNVVATQEELQEVVEMLIRLNREEFDLARQLVQKLVQGKE